MATAADTLRAIEARAEHAILQELRVMMNEILGLRARLVLKERAHVDVLQLKLDPIEREAVSVSATESKQAAFMLPMLEMTALESPAPKAYRVLLYERDYGDLADVVTADTLERGVQVVRDRLAPGGDYAITAHWFGHEGEMTVATPHGTVLARLEADYSSAPTTQPDVRNACRALRAGDASRIECLFGRILESA